MLNSTGETMDISQGMLVKLMALLALMLDKFTTRSLLVQVVALLRPKAVPVSAATIQNKDNTMMFYLHSMEVPALPNLGGGEGAL